jgi:hypothetical protein
LTLFKDRPPRKIENYKDLHGWKWRKNISKVQNGNTNEELFILSGSLAAKNFTFKMNK